MVGLVVILEKGEQEKTTMKQGFAERARDKYVPMLVSRDTHVGNHFDKFIPLCQVGYFIEGDEQS